MSKSPRIPDGYARPSLVQTALLANELSTQAWADMNPNLSMTESQSIDDLTEKILAILLIRIIALISTRNLTPNLPVFDDLSTSTICYAILNYQPSSENNSEGAVNNEESSTLDHDGENDDGDDRILHWPERITERIVFQLRQYIYKILNGYRVVPYHNRDHGFHVFISAHKLLDMALCEYDYSQLVSNQPIEKPTRATFGLKNDPLLHLSLLFSALVHDVDHTGVSNRQLVLECDELAIMYNDQSVAEQRSLAIAFSLLMNKDYQALRSIMFQDDDYQRFRKVVIDLVLCTDIASPERVQIVKSKWKEAFGDKHKTLAPKAQFRKTLVPDEVNASLHSVGGRSSIGFDEAPARRNAGFQSGSSRSNLGQEVDNSVSRVSIVVPADDYESKQSRRRSTLSFSQTKKKNVWKSKPADISMGEAGSNRLVRSFFLQRGSQRAFLGRDQDSSSDHNNPSNVTNDAVHVEKKKKFLKVLRIFKRKKEPTRKSVESKQSDSQEPDLEPERRESIAPLRSSATTAPYDGLRSSDNLGSISGILDQYEDDISEYSGISSTATSVYAPNQGDCKYRYYQSKRNSITQASKSNLHDKVKQANTASGSPNGRESSSNDPSKCNLSRNSFKKLYRRFTEPPNQLYDGKKFQFRLGIRRALDLTGNQIDAYGKTSEKKLKNDPDQPDKLKEIVVLEQLMKAADVAANMQSWDTMVTFCKRLFQEQKTCFVDGRGGDPITEWHGNQIAFFESYTMPLACRLVETGIFEYPIAQDLVNGVRQNNIRWMIEGSQVIKKMVKEWEVLQINRETSQNSQPSA